jgi:hypothetical protein
MRILLIEDDHAMRRSLVDRLLAEGVETIYQASDFGRALDFVGDADGIVCDDAFPFVAGEPSFKFAWTGIRDAARAQGKPFVLITGDADMWLDASYQDVKAYRKKHASEAIVDLVETLTKDELASPLAGLPILSSPPDRHQACCP